MPHEEMNDNWFKIAYLDCQHTKIGKTRFEGYGDFECHIYQAFKKDVWGFEAEQDIQEGFNRKIDYGMFGQEWDSEGSREIKGITSMQ